MRAVERGEQLPEPIIAELPRLIITIQDDGSVGVTGPLNNKLLCYGILEAAKDAIKNYQPSVLIKP